MTTISHRTRYFRSFIIRAIAYPVIILLLFALILGYRIYVINSAAHWVDHTDFVIAQADKTLSLAVDSETGVRGYLVNKNPLFLEPYNNAALLMSSQFEKLHLLVNGNQQLSLQVVQMQRQYHIWSVVATEEMNKSLTDPAGFRAYFDRAMGKKEMDILRGEFARFIADQEELKAQREHEVRRATEVTLLVAVALALLSGVTLGAFFLTEQRTFGSEYEAALRASQENEQLLSATLLGIGDAVLVTDAEGRITQMNSIAERLTGWTTKDAAGLSAKVVFNIINETTRETVLSPVERVLQDGVIVGLANHTLLISRNGKEIPIDDSGAPIKNDRGKLIGVVLVFRDISERKEAEKLLVASYEREHRIADNLQRALLTTPDASRFTNLEFGTLYEPAWDEALVGGDYYDIFALPDGRAAMIVGDISGKGLEAASRTAEMKYTFRAYLFEDADGAAAATRLNRFVIRLLQSNQDTKTFFLCLTVVIYDPKTGIINVTVCGADAPVLLKTTGVSRDIQAGGAPIGTMDDSVYSSTDVALADGDVLIVATDGITEARHGKDFLDRDGLIRLASALDLTRSMEQIGANILRSVKEYASGQLHDDVCMLVCRYKQQQ